MTTPLDTIRVNETPEGVDLGLRVAGPAPRALALVADGAIRLALYLVLSPLLALSGFGLGLNLIAIFLLEWLYPVSFEVLTGATPGKRSMGLKVVHDDGTPVGLRASLVRNLLRVIDFLPLFYGVGLVCVLADRDFRRLGDLGAGTLVIHVQRPSARDRVPRPRWTGGRDGAPSCVPPALPTGAAGGARRPVPGRDRGPSPDAPTRQPPLGLPLDTQQSILAFCERAPLLSPARRIELAETLLARLPSPPGGLDLLGGTAAVEQVQGYGSWLARGRAGD